MLKSLRNALGQTKYRLKQAAKAKAYQARTPWSRRIIESLWEDQAAYIHNQWGDDEHDYAVLSQLFELYRPTAILDVGCGSGRLFKLYEQWQIADVVGTDISAQALALAKARYPYIKTIHGRLETLDFSAKRFDLAICNRVLQHLPDHTIEAGIACLCRSSRLVYVNELTDSDTLSEEFYMFQHNYLHLFAQCKFHLCDKGTIDQQTYYLFTES